MQDLMIVSDRAPAGHLTVHSPFDGRELDSVPTSGPNHVDDALAVAHGFFRDRRAWLSVPERVEILSRVAEIMQSQLEELTVLAASEGGKPYMDSKVEVVRPLT